MFSVIDTEENEAKAMVNFLKVQGYKFIDTWYHPYSELMAKAVYGEYVEVCQFQY